MGQRRALGGNGIYAEASVKGLACVTLKGKLSSSGNGNAKAQSQKTPQNLIVQIEI